LQNNVFRVNRNVNCDKYAAHINTIIQYSFRYSLTAARFVCEWTCI